MKSFCFILLASACVTTSLAWVFPEDKCGPHAEFLDCGRCNATCDDPRGICDRSFCRPAGCYCKYPFVMDNDECIIPTECKRYKQSKCGQNELYYEFNESDGEGTCDRPNTAFGTREFQDEGCHCKPGFLRHEGKCIAPSQCPAKRQNPPPLIRCGENAEFLKCGGCNTTCDQPFHNCDRSVCRPSGCFCKYPFVLEKGECVLPTECKRYKQSKCGKNELYYEFNESDGEGTCDRPNTAFGTREFQDEGCHCKPGFLRHEGKCIQPSECPSAAQGTCKRNEVHLNDGEGDCERTCENPDVVVCTKHFFPAGCYCLPPFVRDNGHCIDRKECMRLL